MRAFGGARCVRPAFFHGLGTGTARGKVMSFEERLKTLGYEGGVSDTTEPVASFAGRRGIAWSSEPS